MEWLYCNIGDFSQYEYNSIYRSLTHSRKEHIDRFGREADRKRSLAGELLIKRLLQVKFGITSPLIERLPNGRPILSGEKLFISIAHCEDNVVCAVSEKPIGIDIERIKPIKLSLTKRFCVSEELDYIVGNTPYSETLPYCEDKEILNRFYEIWTAKEAYFKMLGTGITDLKSVNVLKLKRSVYSVSDYLVQIICEE